MSGNRRPAKEKEAEAAPKKSGLSGKVKIGIILVAVVACTVRASVAACCRRRGQQRDLRKARATTAARSHELAAVQQEDPHAERREVDLGKFSVTSIDLASQHDAVDRLSSLRRRCWSSRRTTWAAQADGTAAMAARERRKNEGEPEDNSRFGKAAQEE